MGSYHEATKVTKVTKFLNDQLCSSCLRDETAIEQSLPSSTSADGEEEPAFVPEGADPAQLRQPALGPPVIGCTCEQLLRFLAQHGARVGPEVLDPILGRPA